MSIGKEAVKRIIFEQTPKKGVIVNLKSALERASISDIEYAILDMEGKEENKAGIAMLKRELKRRRLNEGRNQKHIQSIKRI